MSEAFRQSLTRTVQELSLVVSEYKSRMTVLDASMDELGASRASEAALRNRLDEMSASLAEMDGSLTAAAAERDVLHRQLIEANATITRLSADAEVLATVQAELGDVYSSSKAAQLALDAAFQERAALETALSKIRLELADQVERVVTLDRELQQATQEKEASVAQLAAAQVTWPWGC